MTNAVFDGESAKTGILALLDVLKYNRKALTVNALARLTDTSPELVKAFLKALDSLDYLKVKKSPSGRLINFSLWPFSKRVYYTDFYSCIIERGLVTHGDYRSIRQNNDCVFFQRRLQELEDCARNDGLIYIRSELNNEQLCSELLKSIGILQETITTDMSLFPLVTIQIKKLEQQRAALIQEVHEEQRNNDANQQWFNNETKKAARGERFRVVYKDGRYLGTRTIFSPAVAQKDSEWNGGNTIWSYPSEVVAEYEQVAVKVPDFPKPIPKISTKANANASQISDLSNAIEEFKRFPAKWEALLTAESVRHEKLAQLDKQINMLKAQRDRI